LFPANLPVILSAQFQEVCKGDPDQLRIVFADHGPKETRVLSEILGVGQFTFTKDLKQVFETTTFLTTDFAEELKTGTKVDTLKIAQAAQWLLQPPRGRFKEQMDSIGGHVALTPPICSEQNCQLASEWQEFYEDTTKAYRLSWRVYFEVKRTSPGVWNYTSMVDIGRRGSRESFDQIEKLTDSRRLGNSVILGRTFDSNKKGGPVIHTVGQVVPAGMNTYNDAPRDWANSIQIMGNSLFYDGNTLLANGRSALSGSDSN